MVGSPFIYTECGTRRTLLNTTQIAVVHVNEVDVNSKDATPFERQFDPPSGKYYTLDIQMVYGRPFSYIFATAADRDAMYEKIMAAVAPAVSIIDTSPDVPRKPKDPEAPNRTYTRDEVYLTKEEFEEALAKVTKPKPADTPPPTPKSPRKPYTRKPRE